jgi:hypothetical protein
MNAYNDQIAMDYYSFVNALSVAIEAYQVLQKDVHEYLPQFDDKLVSMDLAKRIHELAFTTNTLEDSMKRTTAIALLPLGQEIYVKGKELVNEEQARKTQPETRQQTVLDRFSYWN